MPKRIPFLAEIDLNNHHACQLTLRRSVGECVGGMMRNGFMTSQRYPKCHHNSIFTTHIINKQKLLLPQGGIVPMMMR